VVSFTLRPLYPRRKNIIGFSFRPARRWIIDTFSKLILLMFVNIFWAGRKLEILDAQKECSKLRGLGATVVNVVSGYRLRNTEKQDPLSFTHQVHERGSVPAAMRDRWTEGEVIYGNSRCRELDVTVLVSMRRNNTRNTWL
jgi:hypothetical protein